MKIYKYGHACFVAENHGQSLIVDPGDYSLDLVVPDNTVAVVVTHEHADHVSRTLLQKIIDKNPHVIIVTHQNVASKLSEFNIQCVRAGETFEINGFNLEFFGGQHAIIDKDWPAITNLGVLINNQLYYPGDSFAIPDRPVNILALPISAPWLKISEALHFLRSVKPAVVFPTHDAILSDTGKELLDRMIHVVAQNTGTHYRRINKESLEA